MTSSSPSVPRRGRPTVKKVLQYFSSSDMSLVIEFQPNKRRSDGEYWSNGQPNLSEQGWATTKRIEVDGKTLPILRENFEMSRQKFPELYKVTNEGSDFYIGIDSLSGKCIVTDRNPHVEGLLDIHKCICLPSSFHKNQNLPSYLAQDILFVELPNPTLITPGIVPGHFFITPRLVGCSIFVAYDDLLHKYWVIRISRKNKKKPNKEVKTQNLRPKNATEPRDVWSPALGPGSQAKGGSSNDDPGNQNSQNPAFAECVLDYLRLNGFNTKFIIRVASYGRWKTDVREQKFWLDPHHHEESYDQFMYTGEAVFYGVCRGGAWKFGLKTSQSHGLSQKVVNKFPLMIKQGENNIQKGKTEDSEAEDEDATRYEAEEKAWKKQNLADQRMQRTPQSMLLLSKSLRG